MKNLLWQGKRKDNGEWFEGYVFDNDFSDNRKFFVGSITIDDEDEIEATFFYEVDPDTLRQFTGLPDKENKRIFEADIFKSDSGHIGVVTFGAYKQDGAEHYGFYIKWNDDEQLRKDILYWIDKGCVVGNVHDNPNCWRV